MYNFLCFLPVIEWLSTEVVRAVYHISLGIGLTLGRPHPHHTHHHQHKEHCGGLQCYCWRMLACVTDGQAHFGGFQNRILKHRLFGDSRTTVKLQVVLICLNKYEQLKITWDSKTEIKTIVILRFQNSNIRKRKIILKLNTEIFYGFQNRN